jgi:integrase
MVEEKPFLWSAVRWVFYQFIRPDELRNLKISDIDFDDWKIKVKATSAKNSRSVWMPIVDGLKAELQPLSLYQYPQNYYVIGLDGLPS